MSPATCLARAAAVAAILAAFAPPAQAQDPHMPPTEKDAWTFELGAYYWMTRMEGSVESQGLVADISSDYGDIIQRLGSTFALRFEAWQRDSFGIAFDTCWIKLDDTADFAAGEGDVEVDFGFTEITAAGRTRSGNAYMDVYGGLRWIRFESNLEPPGGGIEEGSTNYYDPMIGLRVGFTGSNWIHGSLRFDVGGFGVGTDRTATLALVVDFRVGDAVILSAGWRTMNIEVKEGDREVDLYITGPLVSVKIGF